MRLNISSPAAICGKSGNLGLLSGGAGFPKRDGEACRWQ
jgi:hypothetical protein